MWPDHIRAVSGIGGKHVLPQCWTKALRKQTTACNKHKQVDTTLSRLDFNSVEVSNCSELILISQSVTWCEYTNPICRELRFFFTCDAVVSCPCASRSSNRSKCLFPLITVHLGLNLIRRYGRKSSSLLHNFFEGETKKPKGAKKQKLFGITRNSRPSAPVCTCQNHLWRLNAAPQEMTKWLGSTRVPHNSSTLSMKMSTKEAAASHDGKPGGSIPFVGQSTVGCCGQGARSGGGCPTAELPSPDWVKTWAQNWVANHKPFVFHAFEKPCRHWIFVGKYIMKHVIFLEKSPYAVHVPAVHFLQSLHFQSFQSWVLGTCVSWMRRISPAVPITTKKQGMAPQYTSSPMASPEIDQVQFWILAEWKTDVHFESRKKCLPKNEHTKFQWQ